MYLRLTQDSFNGNTIILNLSGNSKYGVPYPYPEANPLREPILAKANELLEPYKAGYDQLVQAEQAAVQARLAYVESTFKTLQPELEQLLTDFPDKHPEYLI